MQAKAVATAGSMRRTKAGTGLWAAGRASSVVIGGASSEHVEPVADLQEAGGADRDDEKENDPLEQLLPERVDVEGPEQPADRRIGERAKDRSDGAAAAAVKGYAADHDGGDRGERIGAPIGKRRLAGVGD